MSYSAAYIDHRGSKRIYPNIYARQYAKGKMFKKGWKRYYGFDSKEKGKRSAYRSVRGKARFTRDYTRTVADKALATARYVKSLINVEYKTIDNNISGSYDNSGSVQVLSMVAQGDTAVARDGNSILVKSLSFRAQINQDASATNTIIRIILFIDKEYNQAKLTPTEILNTVNTRAHLNLDFARRIKVLRDIALPFSATGVTQAYVKEFIPLDIHIKYDAGTAAEADCKENQLCMLVISSEATNTPYMAATSRIRFIDN